MSIDLLQARIRKLKCPIIADLSVQPQHLPPHLAGDTETEKFDIFCRGLMEGLKPIVPAVRFSFDHFAMMENGLSVLPELLRYAKKLGFYVVLDGPAMLSPWAAERAVKTFFESELYPCDALVLSPYVGSDVIKPFEAACKDGKALFFAVRSANKSASELQDLITGGRLCYEAAADIVNRYAGKVVGKCGYSQMGLLTAATNANAVKNLRSKYNRLFLLVDGYDYPGGNAKNCSLGFDKFGHGAAVSIGPAIAAAWAEEESSGEDYVQRAVAAVERINANIERYIAIL